MCNNKYVKNIQVSIDVKTATDTELRAEYARIWRLRDADEDQFSANVQAWHNALNILDNEFSRRRNDEDAQYTAYVTSMGKKCFPLGTRTSLDAAIQLCADNFNRQAGYTLCTVEWLKLELSETQERTGNNGSDPNYSFHLTDGCQHFCQIERFTPNANQDEIRKYAESPW